MYLLGRVQMMAPTPYEDGVKTLMKKGFDGIEFGMSDRQFKPRPEFFAQGFADKMKKDHGANRCKGVFGQRAF